MAAMLKRQDPRVPQEPFGRMPGGQEVHLFTLGNDNGVEVKVMTCGATIVSLRALDR